MESKRTLCKNIACQAFLGSAMLLQHLGAVDGFLKAMQNHSGYDSIREKQFELCRSKINGMPNLNIEEVSALVVRIARMPWTDYQVKALQVACDEKVGGMVLEKGSKGRRPLQNYVNFPMYLTQSIWLALLSGQHAPAVLIAMLAKHLANLGLRLPSEKTCSMITAVLLWRQHRNFDDVQKHQLYIQVKAQLKKLLSCVSDQSPGCSYVVDLPLNPNELSKEWQDRAFAQEARADPQMDTQILHMIQSSIRERVSPMVATPPVSQQVGIQNMSFGNGLRNLQIFHPEPRRVQDLGQAPSVGTGMLALANGPACQPEKQASQPAMQPTSQPASQQPAVQQLQPLAEPANTMQPMSQPAAQQLQPPAQAAEAEVKVPRALGKRESGVDKMAEVFREKLNESKGSTPKAKAKGKPKPKAKPKANAASKAKPKKPVGSTTMKRPAAAMKRSSAKPQDALKRYPSGCPKCRYKPGCTPSCFRYRNEWW